MFTLLLTGKPIILYGGMPEWLIGAVLKTVVRASVPRVRIPIPPPFIKSDRLNVLSDFIMQEYRYSLTGHFI